MSASLMGLRDRYSYVVNNPTNLADPSGMCINAQCPGYGAHEANAAQGGSQFLQQEMCASLSNGIGDCWEIDPFDFLSIEAGNSDYTACPYGDCSTSGYSTLGALANTFAGPGGVFDSPASLIPAAAPQTQGKSGCLVTVFDPSCKPKEPPSCPTVFVKGTLDAFANGGPAFPPGENPEDLVRAGGGAFAASYIVEHGLVVPLRSSVVRGIPGVTEDISLAVAVYPVVEAEALKQEVQDWSSGACSTAWNK